MLDTSPEGYYRAKGSYKTAKGKYAYKRLKLIDDLGYKIKNNGKAPNRKKAEILLVKLQFSYQDEQKIDANKLDEANFVEEFYKHQPKEDKSNAVIKFIETFIDEHIRTRTCKDMFDHTKMFALRDKWCEYANKSYEGEDFYPRSWQERYKWSYNTHKTYFQGIFKPTCTKIIKRNNKFLNKISMSNIDNFEQHYKPKPLVYLERRHIDFIKSCPPYKDVVNAYPYNKTKANNNPDYQHKEAYLFCLETGLRQTDLSRLCWRHIIGESTPSGEVVFYLNIMTSKSKKRKRVTVPLSDVAYKLIGERKADDDFIFRLPRIYNEDGSFNEVKNAEAGGLRASSLKTYLKASKRHLKSDINLKKIIWHNARHTFANKFLRLYKDIALTAEMLGHSVTTCARKYARYDERDMKHIHARINELSKVDLNKNVLDEAK